MNCYVSEQQLEQWFFNELSPEEHSKLVEHMETCEKCKRYLEELQMLHRAWDSELLEPSDAFVDRVMKAIEQEPIQKVTYLRKKADNTTNPKAINGRVLDFIHYLTAVAATFLLVYMGGFDQLPNIMGELSERVTEANENLQKASDSGLGWISGIHYLIQGIIDQIRI